MNIHGPYRVLDHLLSVEVDNGPDPDLIEALRPFEVPGVLVDPVYKVRLGSAQGNVAMTRSATSAAVMPS